MKRLMAGQGMLLAALFLSAFCKMPESDSSLTEVKVIHSPILWLQEGNAWPVNVNIGSVTTNRKNIVLNSNYSWLSGQLSKDYKELTISAQNAPKVTGKYHGTISLSTGEERQILAVVHTPVYVFTGGQRESRHVLLIGICGFRPDAIPPANAPYIKLLMRHGLYALNATTQLTGITGSDPGWASVLTGVEAVKHKVTNNSETSRINRSHPTLLKWLNEKKLPACIVANDEDLLNILEPDVPQHKASIQTEFQAKANALLAARNKIKADTLTPLVQLSDSLTTDKTKALLASGSYNFIFLHYGGIDIVGHLSGFGPRNPLYLDAVERVDRHIGTLLDAIMLRPAIGREDWLIVIAADHSGEGYTHDQTNRVCQTIPLIFFSPSLKKGQMNNASHLDVYPSVLHFFQISDHPPGLDGRNQLEVSETH